MAESQCGLDEKGRARRLSLLASRCAKELEGDHTEDALSLIMAAADAAREAKPSPRVLAHIWIGFHRWLNPDSQGQLPAIWKLWLSEALKDLAPMVAQAGEGLGIDTTAIRRLPERLAASRDLLTDSNAPWTAALATVRNIAAMAESQDPKQPQQQTAHATRRLSERLEKLRQADTEARLTPPDLSPMFARATAAAASEDLDGCIESWGELTKHLCMPKLRGADPLQVEMVLGAIQSLTKPLARLMDARGIDNGDLFALSGDLKGASEKDWNRAWVLIRRLETKAKAASQGTEDPETKPPPPPATQNDDADPFQPCRWFTRVHSKKLGQLLRDASSQTGKRKTMTVRKLKAEDGTNLYSVRDAQRHWPELFKPSEAVAVISGDMRC